jgi:hypothetical protein
MSGIRQFQKFCQASRSKFAKPSLRMLEKFFATVPKNNSPRRTRQYCPIPEEEHAVIADLYYRDRLSQYEIAQQYRVNEGRINEIVKEFVP